MRQVVARALTQNKTNGLSGLLARQAIPICIVAGLIWLMRDHVAALDFAEIRRTLAAIEIYQWCLAFGATAGSFWAIGRYDEIVHALLRSRVSTEAARTAGITAVAISQFAGFGALTASLVRWRMLPEVSLIQALRISAVVTLSFLAGWAFVTAALALFLGTTPTILDHAAGIIVGMGLILLVLPFATPRWPKSFPSTVAMVKIITLVAIDVGFAALALYALLPSGVIVDLAPFILAFSVALLAGLMSGTPGGIGAFELCLLTQMPQLEPDTLVAAALGFRLVYHVLPALLAMTLLIIGPKPDQSTGAGTITYPRVPILPPRLEATLWHAPFAEAKLLRQGEFALMGANRALVCEMGQSLVVLGCPLKRQDFSGDWLHEVHSLAQFQSRAAGIYKAPPRLAARARDIGWCALPVAQDAVLEPANYGVEGASRRQLRRMLRKSEKAGVTIEEAGRHIPMTELAQISKAWAHRNDGERGFSMGRFCPDYVQYQRVFLAREGAKVVGFVTFHETRDQWTLDLVRHSKSAPTGTMHALVHAAILAAKNQRVPSISLAACPFDGVYSHWLPQKIAKYSSALAGAEGLRRFKSSFDPRWQTRYALAPNWAEMTLMLWDVTLRVHGRLRIKRARKGSPT